MKEESKGTIVVVLKEESSREIFIAMEGVNVDSLICRLFKLSQQSESYSFKESLHDPLWEEKQLGFQGQIKDRKVSLQKWQKYFEYYGHSSTIIRTQSLLELVLDGIPNSLRRMYFNYLFVVFSFY